MNSTVRVLLIENWSGSSGGVLVVVGLTVEVGLGVVVAVAGIDEGVKVTGMTL